MISWAFSLFEKGDITNGDETSLRQKCDKNGKTAKKLSCHECFSFMDKFFLIMPQAGRTDCHLDANFLRLRTSCSNLVLAIFSSSSSFLKIVVRSEQLVNHPSPKLNPFFMNLFLKKLCYPSKPERSQLEVEVCLHRHHTCFQVGQLFR